jgi:hypothetical protein
MAIKSIAILKTAENEGGYAKPYGNSGETYAGVDRLHVPNWPGWKIIDAYKATKGLRQYQFIKNDVQLDTYVQLAYQKYWDSSRAELIKNTELANFYFDFYFHKPAIAVGFANEIARALNTTVVTNKSFLTNEVAYVINANAVEVYGKLYKMRMSHYSIGLHPQNYTGEKLKYIKSKNGLITRVKKYPATIAEKKKFSGFLSYLFN